MALATQNQRKRKHQDKVEFLACAIDFGKQTINVFDTPFSASSPPAGFVDSLICKIETFPKNIGATASNCRGELDKLGTALWNQCTRLRRILHASDLSLKVALTNILLGRIYALLLLDYTQNSDNWMYPNVIRLLRLSFKIIKNCIELKQYALTTVILEKAGSYDEYLQSPNPGWSEDDLRNNMQLNAEYFALRTVLACKQEKFEIAEHLFTKVMASKQHLDPKSAENTADVLYELAKRHMTKGQYVLATVWFDRSLELLMVQDLHNMSSDASELRISILQNSVAALLKCQDVAATEQAGRIIGMLESELGPKLVVLLLKLEILESSANKVFDAEAYALVLYTMIESILLNNDTFKTLMHHIRRLNDRSPSLACKVLDTLISARLCDGEHRHLVESVVVNRLWITNSQKDEPELVLAVHRMLDTLHCASESPLSASATHAAQILLWKHVEQNFCACAYEASERWCRLALHPIFDLGTGDTNKAKIIRKLLMCALARLDLDSAQQAVQSMSEHVKNETMSQFLLFKLAIRTNNVELAQASLGNVGANSKEDPNLLYACVLDAQKAGYKEVAVSALELVLDRNSQQVSTIVHQPALLRCIIRVIISMLPTEDLSQQTETAAIIDQLCRLFHLAASQAQGKHTTANGLDSICDQHELDWFSRNSYNLALKYSTVWHPRQVYRMISASIVFCEMFPCDLDLQARSDVQLRRIFSDYLASILLVTLARAEDNIEQQLQDYLALRKHVTSFDELTSGMASVWAGPVMEDLNKKLCSLLAFDFEAAVKLRKWQDLIDIAMKAEGYKSLWVFEVFADCLLTEEVPHDILIARLKAIVNSAWSIEGLDTIRFSRYMRLLFQIAVIHEEKTALGLLISIEQHIEDAKSTDCPYPYEEIEWIATTTFNHAIDFYCTNNDLKCKEWASRAISIASHLNDVQALQNLLVQKLAGLTFDDVG